MATIFGRFRWTHTATTLQSLLIGLRTSFSQGCMQNLRLQSNIGLHWTSDEGACKGSSNFNVKAAGWLHYLQSVTMLMSKAAKTQVPHEGMVKRQKNITWQCFKAALNGSFDKAENRGFCMVCSRGAKQMATYEEQKLGLSTYYDKHWMLLDGIHTEPFKFYTTWAGGSCVFGGTINSSLWMNPCFGPSCK